MFQKQWTKNPILLQQSIYWPPLFPWQEQCPAPSWVCSCTQHSSWINQQIKHKWWWEPAWKFSTNKRPIQNCFWPMRGWPGILHEPLLLPQHVVDLVVTQPPGGGRPVNQLEVSIDLYWPMTNQRPVFRVLTNQKSVLPDLLLPHLDLPCAG